MSQNMIEGKKLPHQVTCLFKSGFKRFFTDTNTITNTVTYENINKQRGHKIFITI